MPFRTESKLYLVLSDFHKMQRYKLKKLVHLFQVIHFHPGHPQLRVTNIKFSPNNINT